MLAPVVLDFETEAIEPRPTYPPRPVGLAISEPGRKSAYLAWGHASGNNCTKAEAAVRLKRAWRGKRPLVFHNAPFDEYVAHIHFDLPILPWDRVHCTMILAFLTNPERKRIDLKELASDLLGIPPDERDELREWILKHVPGAKKKKSEWAAHISKAPGSVVAKYAIGDVTRPRDIFNHLRKSEFWASRDFQRAYERERRCIEVMIGMGRTGVPVNRRALQKDAKLWQETIERVDQNIRRRTKISDLDVDSNQDLAYGLVHGGFAREEDFPPTPKTKKPSVTKDVIDEVILDPTMRATLRYRSSLTYALRTFALPWLEISKNDGRIYCNWNSVKQVGRDGKRTAGARTGRLSSSPNFQNIPKKPPEFEKLRMHVPALPWMRNYIQTVRNRCLLDRDYSQQELRILAHYEGGELMRAYNENPRLDLHGLATHRINLKLGLAFKRDPVKTIGFGIIYGQGILLLAINTGLSEADAQLLKRTYLEIFPGISEVIRDLREKAREKEPFWTWGGRPYYCEEPKILDEETGAMLRFEYKMINTLIQGSAADCTKEFMVNYWQDPRRTADLLLSVHDEQLVECERSARREEMARMQDHMEAVSFDVPMLSDGGHGKTWTAAKMAA
jgi:DNA polymerase I-like protein with 3'-5' exonuclease and polymerase domains